MPTAHSLLPERFADGRHIAIEEGAAAAGYRVRKGAGAPAAGDILLTWNLYGARVHSARRFEQAGAHVVVCEEGFIRRINGDTYFQMALGGHNGSGHWRCGGSERWDGWGIDVAPWRDDGEHILVCGQRGFGYSDMAMPDNWPDAIHARLRALTARPLWYRPHPKRRRRWTRAAYDRVLDFGEPLAMQLRGAWAVVVYTSNAATEALIAGVPAFFDGPHLVTEGVAQQGIDGIERPALADRLPALRRLAWAQWSMREIARGDPFIHLLPCTSVAM